MSSRRILPFALSVVALGGAATAHAQAPVLTGLGGPESFGTECLHRNDDQSSSEIDLRPAFPHGLRFFSATHTSVFVNTNGNLTFSRALSTYTPDPFPVAAQPMIAPYWADIDIRPPGRCSNDSMRTCANPSENGVWWHLEPGRMIVTWDDVGYYRCQDDLRMRFQLILTAVPSCGLGPTDFDVEFRYNRCEWEAGSASGGDKGFGGVEAQVGFDAGNSRDFVSLPGSREAGIANMLCTGSNVDDPGVWRFQIRSGAVVCPDAGEACPTGQMGVCAEGVTQCVGDGVECRPVVPASDEVCDALDNDCDGMVDEEESGASICPGYDDVCDRGLCVASCFEGGCPEGESCVEGRCLDTGCEAIECDAGERCLDGACGDACAGVVCPAGESCRGGRCLDLCADIECDPSCSACQDGECVVRCDSGEEPLCGAGETCTDDGLCVPTACLGVTCPGYQVCRPGYGCVDGCDGVVCPAGETCVDGACMRPPRSDVGGGVTDGGDAGAEDAVLDASTPAMIDGSPPVLSSSPQCLCRAPGTTNGRPLAGLTVAVLLLGVLRLRRRGR